MVNWNAASFDPVAARGGVSGSDYVSKIFDQRAGLDAGNSFASGNYADAIKTLAGRGKFGDAESVAQFGNQQLDRQQQHFNQNIPVLEQVYQTTLDKQGPDAAKAAVVQTFDSLSADAPQYGVPPAKLQAFRQSLITDPQRTLQTAGILTRGKLILQQNGDSIVAIDPVTQRPAWTLTNGKMVNVPEGGKLVPQPQTFRDFTAAGGQQPAGQPAGQQGSYGAQIAAMAGGQPPASGGDPAFQEMFDQGKPGNPGRGPGDPAGTIYGAPKPPTTRRIVQGPDDVSQEFDSATAQWREIGRGPRRQQPQGFGAGPFAGRTEDERLRNILVTGDPASPAYASAYSKMAAPRVVFDPQTGQQISINPDISWARPPSRNGSPASGVAGAAPIPGQNPTAPGQPTVTTAPGRAAPATRATFEANVSQATKDVALAERMFFPGGQFDRGMAMTGAAGVPLTQGREARQAITRAVEIILRLRTGAAAPDSEVRNYANMFAPSALDNDEGAKVKMQRLREFFEDSKRVAGSKLGGAAAGGGGAASQADPLGIR